MECKIIREMMAHNSLTPDEQRIVEKHLALCPSCRAEANLLARMKRDLAALKSEAPPSGLYKFFKHQVQSLQRKKNRSPLIFWQSPLGVIASSTLLLVILIIIMMNLFHPSTSKTPSILIQIFPRGRTVETFHPARQLLLEEVGNAVTIHLIVNDEGKMEKILSMEGGSDQMRRIYGKLLPLWRFDVPNQGDYLLIITIPKPLHK